MGPISQIIARIKWYKEIQYNNFIMEEENLANSVQEHATLHGKKIQNPGE